MSVTLFFCEQCAAEGQLPYKSQIAAMPPSGAWFHFQRYSSGEWVGESQVYDSATIESADLINPLCPCHETPHPVKLVTLDECPHEWSQNRLMTRTCSICGVTQQGRVVFD